MKIKFCGAARTVTGSSHLLSLDDGFKILMDCGLYQGHKDEYDDFNKEWEFDPTSIDVLILSHAHIDHAGRIPKLVNDGFKGQIICTHATRDLCAIMLLDSAYIQERDADYENRRAYRKGKPKVEPLYAVEDIPNTMRHFIAIDYDKSFKIREDIELRFLDAGHILGSATVNLKINIPHRGDVHIGFTGDLGRPDRPILKDPVPMTQADYLISESTYGGRFHDQIPHESERLLEIITETCVNKKGKLIIPSFSVGRTQEIVYMLDKLESSGRLPKIPVYVDSPLAVNATDVFRAHPECFDADIHRYMLHDPNPFGFNRLHYIRKVEESKRLNYSKEPAIIISASGMAQAGRIKHHLYNNIENPKNTVLMVGYCAPQTIGGRLRAGKKTIRMFGEEKKVKARVEIMDSFSAHGDHNEMLAFLDNQDRDKLKKLFLVHGDIERQKDFAKALKVKGFNKIEIPVLAQEFKI